MGNNGIDHDRELRPIEEFRALSIARARMGHEQYGTESLDRGPLYLLKGLGEEIADVGNYWSWLTDQLCPPPGAPLRIYIAGPYTANSTQRVAENVAVARHALGELMRMGHLPLCPHTHSAHMEDTHPQIAYDEWMRWSLSWLALCNGVYLLPGWEQSAGSRRERDKASLMGLPMWERIEDVPLVTR